MLYKILRSLLFQIEPESIHAVAFALLKPLQQALQQRGSAEIDTDPVLSQELWGLKFPHPVGLAAGFDKNAELPHVWAAFGFGLAELGTLTAHAQPGNPRPRLFRLPAHRALINRYGFNNRGAAAVAAALAGRFRHHRPPIPIGINLGKSATTPLNEAAADYRGSLRAVFPLADYIAVNVSSPNTPDLRNLHAKNELAGLLGALQIENRQLAQQHNLVPRPLLVKVSPDLTDGDLRDVVSVAREYEAAGLIATNTTIERTALHPGGELVNEAGGLSGAPLRERSTEIIRTLYRLADGGLPIIGAGGIFNAHEAYEKIRAGASLLQVYTGFVYEGPSLSRQLRRGLRALLQRDGFAHLTSAIGQDA